MSTTSIPRSAATPGRDALQPGCSNCFALCCTAFGFSRSADFAIDKPAGTPCPNLAADFSCGIHDRLRPRGFRGCTVFDCFGAGQAVSQGLFDGVSWREKPESRSGMFAAFKIMRQLHEMLWYLAEAQERAFDADTGTAVQELRLTISKLTKGPVAGLLALDVETLHSRVRQVLAEVSEEVRAAFFASGDELEERLQPQADLAGVDLRTLRLCGANLRGACLIAADLRGADLAGVDLLGADLRDARLEGAELSRALYLAQPQLNSARGNPETRLPGGLEAPGHWHVNQNHAQTWTA
ncbi:pentapeptide repeat-containing protein [Arthrobacter sp. FW305-BF8]|uniref:pentapeptide repeat-containing protein n=1 Tax=Arthrobacter sp. FW305-BF8 TaxID=2879617 RepID=UPI001F4397CA|nr:pentapeptide repeat-containing protein [Arthrobacter sp. FW305-BF8]UKA52400.1 pentapeptide repeat-containing protein [Arthrobacter sp. FW305-BF8]